MEAGRLSSVSGSLLSAPYIPLSVSCFWFWKHVVAWLQQVWGLNSSDLMLSETEDSLYPENLMKSLWHIFRPSLNQNFFKVIRIIPVKSGYPKRPCNLWILRCSKTILLWYHPAQWCLFGNILMLYASSPISSTVKTITTSKKRNKMSSTSSTGLRLTTARFMFKF